MGKMPLHTESRVDWATSNCQDPDGVGRSSSGPPSSHSNHWVSAIDELPFLPEIRGKSNPVLDILHPIRIPFLFVEERNDALAHLQLPGPRVARQLQMCQ